jgi:hypothetical protein
MARVSVARRNLKEAVGKASTRRTEITSGAIGADEFAKQNEVQYCPNSIA